MKNYGKNLLVVMEDCQKIIQIGGKVKKMNIGRVQMKTVIAGSRTIKDQTIVDKVVKSSGFKVSEVICGCAPGVDTLGEIWAKENNISLAYYPADWNTYGKAAGHIRNGQMADNADAVIVIWDGESPGSRNMIKQAKKRNLLLFEYVYKEEELDFEF
jgi:hypothetical protein